MEIFNGYSALENQQTLNKYSDPPEKLSQGFRQNKSFEIAPQMQKEIATSR